MIAATRILRFVARRGVATWPGSPAPRPNCSALAVRLFHNAMPLAGLRLQRQGIVRKGLAATQVRASDGCAGPGLCGQGRANAVNRGCGQAGLRRCARAGGPRQRTQRDRAEARWRRTGQGRNAQARPSRSTWCGRGAGQSWVVPLRWMESIVPRTSVQRNCRFGIVVMPGTYSRDRAINHVHRNHRPRAFELKRLPGEKWADPTMLKRTLQCPARPARSAF